MSSSSEGESSFLEEESESEEERREKEDAEAEIEDEIAREEEEEELELEAEEEAEEAEAEEEEEEEEARETSSEEETIQEILLESAADINDRTEEDRKLADKIIRKKIHRAEKIFEPVGAKKNHNGGLKISRKKVSAGMHNKGEHGVTAGKPKRTEEEEELNEVSLLDILKFADKASNRKAMEGAKAAAPGAKSILPSGGLKESLLTSNSKSQLQCHSASQKNLPSFMPSTTLKGATVDYYSFGSTEKEWKLQVLNIPNVNIASAYEKKKVLDTILRGICCGCITFRNSSLVWRGNHIKWASGDSIISRFTDDRNLVCPLTEDTELETALCSVYKKSKFFLIDKIELLSYTNHCDKAIAVVSNHNFLNRNFTTQNGNPALCVLQPSTSHVYECPKVLYCVRKSLANEVSQRQLIAGAVEKEEVLKGQVKVAKKGGKKYVLIPSDFIGGGNNYNEDQTKEVFARFLQEYKNGSPHYYNDKNFLLYLLGNDKLLRENGFSTLLESWAKRYPIVKSQEVEGGERIWWVQVPAEIVEPMYKLFESYVEKQHEFKPVSLSNLTFTIVPDSSPTFVDTSGAPYGYSGTTVTSSLANVYKQEEELEKTRNRSIYMELNVSLVPVFGNFQLEFASSNKQQQQAPSRESKQFVSTSVKMNALML